jgi:hypothetical protein
MTPSEKTTCRLIVTRFRQTTHDFDDDANRIGVRFETTTESIKESSNAIIISRVDHVQKVDLSATEELGRLETSTWRRASVYRHIMDLILQWQIFTIWRPTLNSAPVHAVITVLLRFTPVYETVSLNTFGLNPIHVIFKYYIRPCIRQLHRELRFAIPKLNCFCKNCQRSRSRDSIRLNSVHAGSQRSGGDGHVTCGWQCCASKSKWRNDTFDIICSFRTKFGKLDLSRRKKYLFVFGIRTQKLNESNAWWCVSRASAAALSTVLRTTTRSYMETCDFQAPAKPKPLSRSRWNFAWLIKSARLRDVQKWLE